MSSGITLTAGRQSRRGVSSGTFSPRNLSGLILWLRADAGITIATGVSQWSDQSGQGNNAVQAVGGSQPAFVASSVMAGKPSVRFDGTDDVLATVAGASTTDHTMIVAGKWVALPGGTKAFLDFGDGAVAGNGSSLGSLNPGNNVWYGYAGYGLPTGSVFDTNPHVWSKTCEANTPVTKGYYDRNLDATDNVRTFAAGSAVIDVGANVSAAVFANFEMAEVLIFNRVLLNAERLSVELYLKNKYGTP